MNILKTALPRSKKLFKKLDRIREAIPPVTCERRNSCCALLPGMTLLEACRIISHLCGPKRLDLEENIVKILEYFSFNPVKIMGCPFHSSDGCEIYRIRPFGCRAYGLWSPDAYRNMSESSFAAQKQTAAAWQSIGVSLPEEVVNHRPPYCEKVQIINRDLINDASLQRINREIIELDQKLTPESEIFRDSYYADLSFFIAACSWGYSEAPRLKAVIVKEFLETGGREAFESMKEKTLNQGDPADLFKK